MKITKDKWRHFYVGIIMTILLHFFLGYFFKLPLQTIIIINLIISAAIGYGFELFSKITKLGRYDFMDAVATFIGSLVGIGIILLLIKFELVYAVA